MENGGRKVVDGTWWRYEEGEWHCTTAWVAGILAATQGDAAPVAAQLQPQPQDGQTRGGEASSEVDLEADEWWRLVGGDAKDSEICEDDSINTDDSSSEASPDKQGLEHLD